MRCPRCPTTGATRQRPRRSGNLWSTPTSPRLTPAGAAPRCSPRLNMPLDAASLAEVAQQNACSAEELLDSVQTVAMCWGRTNYPSKDPLLRAVKKLTSESIGDEHRDTIKGLQALVKLNAQKLKELRKALGDALKNAPRVESTFQRSWNGGGRSASASTQGRYLSRPTWSFATGARRRAGRTTVTSFTPSSAAYPSSRRCQAFPRTENCTAASAICICPLAFTRKTTRASGAEWRGEC